MFTILHALHLLAVVTVIGGSIALRFIVCPRIPATEEGAETRKAILGSWRRVVWISIGLIIITGLANADQAYRRVGLDGLYWMVFGAKFLGAMIIFSVALLLTLPMESFNKFKQERDRWMHVIVGLGAIIIFLSAYLRMNFPISPIE